MSALDDGFAQVSFCLFSQAKKNKTTSLTDKLTNRSPEKKKTCVRIHFVCGGPKDQPSLRLVFKFTYFNQWSKKKVNITYPKLSLAKSILFSIIVFVVAILTSSLNDNI